MPSPSTLRALAEAARAAVTKRSKILEFIQAELFPPPEVVGGVTIRPPRPQPAAAPPAPRPRGRRPRQLELFAPSKWTPRSGMQAATQESLQSILPPDLAATAERVVNRVLAEMTQRYKTKVGRQITHRRTPIEKIISPEELRQEALRLILARRGSLPTVPGSLDAYLYPKVRRLAQETIYRLGEPVYMPRLETTVQKLAREAKEAAKAAGKPEPTIEDLHALMQKSPVFLREVRRTGAAKEFLHSPSGIARTLEAGSPKRYTPPAKATDVELPTGLDVDVVHVTQRGPVHKAPSALRQPPKTPLDELLAKVAAEEAGPEARLQLALRALTPRQREIVSLTLAGKGPMEVARELGVKHPTVVRQHQAAVQKMYQVLRKDILAKQRQAPAPPSKLSPKAELQELIREAQRLGRRAGAVRTGRDAPLEPAPGVVFDLKTPAERAAERAAEAARRAELLRTRANIWGPSSRPVASPGLRGEAILPSEPSRPKLTREELERLWELLKASLKLRREPPPPGPPPPPPPAPVPPRGVPAHTLRWRHESEATQPASQVRSPSRPQIETTPTPMGLKVDISHPSGATVTLYLDKSPVRPGVARVGWLVSGVEGKGRLGGLGPMDLATAREIGAAVSSLLRSFGIHTLEAYVHGAAKDRLFRMVTGGRPSSTPGVYRLSD